MRNPLPILSVSTALALLGACTVGPDYAGPPAVVSAPSDGQAGFVRADEATPTGEPALARWWEALGDPVLNDLQQRALAGSPDIAMAQARLRDARAAVGISKAEGMPSISAMGVAATIRIPDLGGDEDGQGETGGESDSGTSSTNFYNLGLNGSWEIDLFGGRRRHNEAARAGLNAAEASMADAQVSLTSAVAQAYLQFRDRQQRTALAEQAIAKNAGRLELQRQRYERGTGTQIEVDREQAALSDAQRQLSALRAEGEGFANALAVLTGQMPGAVDTLLAEGRDIPLPPADVAVGDPAALIQRRPDIRVAERKLAAETARIGEAQAARFPRLSFMGILGIGGTEPKDLTHLDDFTAIAAPMLQWNFLDFGKGKAQVSQAEAKRDVAEASYRATVLSALRDVEDALGNFRSSREAVAHLARAEASAARIEQLTRQRYELGAGALPELLRAELDHNAAQSRLDAARAELTINFIALQKALGLGWFGEEG